MNLNHHKKFLQVPSICNTNVEYLIWSSSYDLFLSYAGNRRTDQPQKGDFQIPETSKRVNPSKFSFRKFDPKTILSQLISKRK